MYIIYVHYIYIYIIYIYVCIGSIHEHVYIYIPIDGSKLHGHPSPASAGPFCRMRCAWIYPLGSQKTRYIHG